METVNDSALTAWVAVLDDVQARLRSRFSRAEPRRRARHYLRGLVGNVARKEGW